LHFIKILGEFRWSEGFLWPERSWQLLHATIGDVLAWREYMTELGMAPKTLNRRISSLSSFFKYVAGAAAELRLPITVPNPAHAQFIARTGNDPLRETKALTATRARQLMGLPVGNDVLAARDRAIIKIFLYTGIRIGTCCRLNVSDFHQDGEEATLRVHEKGSRYRTIGIHFAAADTLREYLALSQITFGAMFRARKSPRSVELGDKRISLVSMYRLVQGYLVRLPNAYSKDAEAVGRYVYTPHSLRATTATLLLDAGVDIMKVQELLGHKHVTTTQIYDKRRRTTKESASHDVPI
jgi:site-specific recombinase XerD